MVICQVKCFLHRGMFQTNMFLLRLIEGNWWLRDNSIIGTSPRLRCKKRKKHVTHVPFLVPDLWRERRMKTCDYVTYPLLEDGNLYNHPTLYILYTYQFVGLLVTLLIICATVGEDYLLVTLTSFIQNNVWNRSICCCESEIVGT